MSTISRSLFRIADMALHGLESCYSRLVGSKDALEPNMPRSLADLSADEELRQADFARQTIHGRWMKSAYQPHLVSVIVPTYNRSQLLSEAVESVWRQSHRPIELLIVDDGSTDDTSEVVRSWEVRCHDENSMVVRHFRQEHGGAPAARNLGLIESCGEFIQFLDSDDVFLSEKLAACVQTLAGDATADYVWCGRRVAADSQLSQLVVKLSHSPMVIPPAVRVEAEKLSHLAPQAVFGLSRRQLCRRIGPWNEALVRHQDWEYTTRLTNLLSHAWRIDAPLYIVRDHGHGRIDDLKHHRPSALDAIIAAAAAAEKFAATISAGKVPGRAFRARLVRRYFKILRNAIKAGSFNHLPIAAAGIRRNLLCAPQPSRLDSQPSELSKAA